MKCIRKNFWKTSPIWSKWKEIWNKNIQQPNTKERNEISLSKEEIFQMEKNEFIETITMNYIFFFLKNNSEYVFQTVEPQIISKGNDKSIRNTF